MFFGLGADGTVGANKNSIKIIGEETRVLRPGLFRLRLQEIRLADGLAPALRTRPDPLALPDPVGQLHRLPSVQLPGEPDRCAQTRRPGAVFLLNSPYEPEVLGRMPAAGAGADHRQEAEGSTSSTPRRWPATTAWAPASTPSCRPAFFAISGVLPRDEAIAKIK
jgi:pyruvate-ferredoxin/flavodoxin oxidoreductase